MLLLHDLFFTVFFEYIVNNNFYYDNPIYEMYITLISMIFQHEYSPLYRPLHAALTTAWPRATAGRRTMANGIVRSTAPADIMSVASTPTQSPITP